MYVSTLNLTTPRVTLKDKQNTIEQPFQGKMTQPARHSSSFSIGNALLRARGNFRLTPLARISTLANITGLRFSWVFFFRGTQWVRFALFRCTVI